jgi:pimeloyl-ACP methyl ester carboxylesterase
MRPTEISANGFVFGALQDGPPDGPLVLLLHGWPQTSWAWRRQLPALAAAGYHAVAVDQRGYSPGARPDGVAAYRIGELAGDALAVADTLGAGRFSVVGHDWGGAVAWHLGGTAAERLHTLTVASTPHPLAMARALKGWDQRRRLAYVPFLRSPLAEVALTAGGGVALRRMLRLSGLREVEPYVAALGTRERMRGPLNYYRAVDGRALRDLQRITTPTLYVWGDRDPALGPAAAHASGDQVDGRYRFEILRGEGHWIPERAADRFNELLLDHLAA